MAKMPKSILELASREAILDLARRNYGPLGIAEKLVPAALRPRQEPQPSCYVYDPAGKLFAELTPQTAEERYGGRPDYRIEPRKPSPQKMAVWRRWQELQKEAETLCLEFAAANLIDYRDTAELDRYQGLYKALADAMGATRWRRIGRDDVLPYAPGFGGRGHEFLTPHGRVFLDVGVEDGFVLLPQIALERTGTGLGSRILEAISAYAAEHRLDVCVYKVCNAPFFARFAWLEARLDGSEFRASAADLAARVEPATAALPHALAPR